LLLKKNLKKRKKRKKDIFFLLSFFFHPFLFRYDYTSKSHLVGVISNGTAVLGLGNIGALASKPVMEGKAVLFKKFGGVDAFDIEVNESDPLVMRDILSIFNITIRDKFINIVCSLEPTFGGVNIEDVKAPECFYIEKEVQRRCSIPIM